jgi:hypothetical protein
LELLKSAELVYTNRLHVALPCLAFGTPVIVTEVDRIGAPQQERFTVLDEIGFQYGAACTMDVSRYADEYANFVAGALNMNVRVSDPVYPEPVNE